MSNPDKIHIDATLVHHLINTQFPDWANLSIKPVEFSGWDNRTFHLGEYMTVRLPSGADYSQQAEKEEYWLPKLEPHLPLSIPIPLAIGKPTTEYPWHWSVRKWFAGDTASIERIADLPQFAVALAEFLIALHRCDPAGGPVAGEHNFYRGGALATYDSETQAAILNLDDQNIAGEIEDVWNIALDSTWKDAPVWIHGDIAIGNLLVENGQLSAIIDFGQLGIGDPACDLAIAWTLFNGKSRDAFRAALILDSATWERGRGWALWKALCWAFPGRKQIDWSVVNEILSDHKLMKESIYENSSCK